MERKKRGRGRQQCVHCYLLGRKGRARSGDLELGGYAQEADGSHISNVPAYTYTDAASPRIFSKAPRTRNRTCGGSNWLR